MTSIVNPQVIVFSCVRANARGALGFLSDARRVNVALTRARRALIVIGDARTLESDGQTWAPWLRWARARGLVVGEPKRDRNVASVVNPK